MKNLFSLLILLLAVGCSSIDEEITPQTQTPVDVYIAGQKNNQACYWKNNQEILLANGESASADTLIVANDDVHILGKKQYDNWITEFLYWKNNVRTNLTETLSTQSEIVRNITGMEVVGTDVYLVGYTKNPLITAEIYEFSYWKNGVQTVLAIVNNPTYQAKIKVVNNDVYVTGNASNCFDNCEGVFKNGVFTPLNNVNLRLTDFAINNDEVSVYGNNYSNNSGYYKNLNSNTESTITQNINKLIFEGNDLYILSSGIILKNGIQIPTTAAPSNGITNYIAFIQDFRVLDGNVFYILRGNTLNGVPFSLVGINNTNVFESLDNSASFNGISLVQN